MESNNFDTEKTPKTTLFTLKNVAVAVGILAALGLVTAGSLRLLRGGSESLNQSEQTALADESEENDISDQVQSINLVFDVISSRTPYWIPFFVSNSLYGIIPKQADNTCTYLNTEAVHNIDGFNPKITKDRKYVIFCGTKGHHWFDVDNGSFITDRTVYHEDRHFAVTGENLIIGDVIERRMIGNAQIKRYNLEMFNASAVIFNCLNTKCERNQRVRVLAATNDDSKVLYACEDSVPPVIPKNKPI